MTNSNLSATLNIDNRVADQTLQTRENAAHRSTYQGTLSLVGINEFRSEALKKIPPLIAQFHKEAIFHIHDLEALGRAPNCLVIDFKRCFPVNQLSHKDKTSRVLGIFDFLRFTVTSIANEQSGGIAFGNLDEDIAWACVALTIDDTDATRDLIQAGISGFIDWVNNTHTRYGLECYYITVNIGISTTPLGRHVTACFLNNLQKAPASFIRPNIVFKVKSGINKESGSPNRDLLDLALTTTALRMIPTYLLCDSSPNVQISPELLAIVGCRTRIAANEHGPVTAIGRGNIAYLTVNLPRLAWQISNDKSNRVKIDLFAKEWQKLAQYSAEILLMRRQLLEELPASFFPGHISIDPWLETFSSEQKVRIWDQGTLSIGFVGLAEAVEIISGYKFGLDDSANQVAIEMVSSMRSTIDFLRTKHRTNFTLLATSAEMAAGKFAKYDWDNFRIPSAEKGFYTNSFHVPVDISLGPINKFRLEAPFHAMCNGGGISYVEFTAPPLGNCLAIEDLISAGVEYGVSYFGVNFPRDVCKKCGQVGIFDICTNCNSMDISRFRRVSGYLEEIEGFTPGKQAEVALRSAHI
jgi:ribonucleoside-triphosphate reductase